MNSLPIELFQKIALFVTSSSDKISLKMVSSEFNRAVLSISIRISKFNTVFSKPRRGLNFCAKSECGPVDWSPLGYNYNSPTDQNKIYYPYCFNCCYDIYGTTCPELWQMNPPRYLPYQQTVPTTYSG